MRLTVDEARARFTAARVARLATAGRDGRPHLVPVTFAVTHAEASDRSGIPAGATGSGAAAAGRSPGTARIVTAVDHKPKTTTTGLRRLRNIAENPQVSLLVDRYDDEWSQLWWTRADGHARIVEPGRAEHAATIAPLLTRYEQYRTTPPAGPAILVTVTRWSGWALRAQDDPGDGRPPPTGDG